MSGMLLYRGLPWSGKPGSPLKKLVNYSVERGACASSVIERVGSENLKPPLFLLVLNHIPAHCEGLIRQKSVIKKLESIRVLHN